MAEQSTDNAKSGSTNVSVQVVSSASLSPTLEQKTTPPKDERDKEPLQPTELVSVDKRLKMKTDELLEALRLVIETSVREHGLENLKELVRQVKLYLDCVMNSEGQYRSRGNWHVVATRRHFAHAVSSDHIATFLVNAPLPALHVLVFYA